MRSGSWLFGALLCGACSTPATQRVDDPYVGEAFPDQRPRFELPPGPFGLVSNNGSDSVTLVDFDARAALGTAPVGLDPVDNDGPHHIAVDRSAGLAFIALAYPEPTTAPGPHAAHGGSARAGYVQALALETLAPVAELEVAENPGDIVLSADGKRLIVSHFDLARVLREKTLEARRADLAVIDVAQLGTRKAAARFIRTCIAPHGMALLDAAGDQALVSCYGEDAIAIVDTTDPDASPELVSLGPGGVPGSPIFGPYAAVLSADAKSAAVSNTLSKDVRVLDVAARSFGPAVETPGAPYFSAWSADGARLFVPVQSPDALVVIDVASGQASRVRTFQTEECAKPHVAVLVSDDSLYLVCEGDHQSDSVVVVLDPTTLDVVASIPVGVYPDALVIAGAAP